MTVLRQADLEVSPWKNGLGRKADVASGDGWFVGLAWLDADAPFSHFPRTERTCVLVTGAGVTLELEGLPPVSASAPGDAMEFPGDVPTVARLAGGPCTVFNVMSDRDGPGHRTGLARTLPVAGYAVVLRGAVTGPDGTARPGDVLVLPHEGTPSGTCCSPGCCPGRDLPHPGQRQSLLDSPSAAPVTWLSQVTVLGTSSWR